MNSKMRAVEESLDGLYVWEMPDGRWIGDDEHNFLSIPGHKGSIKAMAVLRRTVAQYIDPVVGQPLFLSGRRQITDEEYQQQNERAASGLVPDPYDDAAMRDEIRFGKRRD